MIEPLGHWAIEGDYPIGEFCGDICDPTIAPPPLYYYEAGEGGVSE